MPEGQREERFGTEDTLPSAFHPCFASLVAEPAIVGIYKIGTVGTRSIETRFLQFFNILLPHHVSEYRSWRSAVSTQICAAKKIFLSNACGDEVDPRRFDFPTVDPNRICPQLYASIKAAGKFRLC